MDRQNEQCVFTDYWKNYAKFVLNKIVVWKDDNALLLISELTLAALATGNLYLLLINATLTKRILML
jgi:hypothetical protein